jgi:hypothetical protein
MPVRTEALLPPMFAGRLDPKATKPNAVVYGSSANWSQEAGFFWFFLGVGLRLRGAPRIGFKLLAKAA